MSLLQDFVQAFGVWPQAVPYLDLMFDEQEMRLIVELNGRACTPQGVAQLLGVTMLEAAALLERSYSRCITDKTSTGGSAIYSPTVFSKRLDHFAKYENWDDIPFDDRRAIDSRFLEQFIAQHRGCVERKMKGHQADNALPNDTLLLLSEVEVMLEAATHIVMQPCDCRRLHQGCDRPIEVCIWLEDGALEALSRGHGRRLTKAAAIDLVRWADRKGLMHTSDGEWRTRGMHAICSCCACDCYPFRAAQELGSKGVWPRSRYIAVHDAESCSACGLCVQRCHFDAFYQDLAPEKPAGKVKTNVRYSPDRCWGCGLCANTCPTGAIVMERLP
jgi:Pyruvate/2-oxoacid:ferredoxin oxidoreductase delta subunit